MSLLVREKGRIAEEEEEEEATSLPLGTMLVGNENCIICFDKHLFQTMFLKMSGWKWLAKGHHKRNTSSFTLLIHLF